MDMEWRRFDVERVRLEMREMDLWMFIEAVGNIMDDNGGSFDGFCIC